MNTLQNHEIFEILTLEQLKKCRILDKLIFGGGTMLRLCHGLKRYSVDLDFWPYQNNIELKLLEDVVSCLKEKNEITDAENKRFTTLIEIRNKNFPKRLKIEIRNKFTLFDFQQNIAWSPYSDKQVAIRTHTLEQTIQNKLSALFDRREIRDAFDLEFLLRNGVKLPKKKIDFYKKILNIIDGFVDIDYKVKLGSIIEKNMRDYYANNKFNFLINQIVNKISFYQGTL